MTSLSSPLLPRHSELIIHPKQAVIVRSYPVILIVSSQFLIQFLPLFLDRHVPVELTPLRQPHDGSSQSLANRAPLDDPGASP